MKGQAQSVARALRDALRALSKAQNELEGACTRCGVELDEPRAHALMALMGDESCRDVPTLTIQQLSEHTDIDRSNVSRLCQRMERDGELERARCPQDARAKLVRLTDLGMERAGRVDTMSLERFERVAARRDEAAQHSILCALNTLTEALLAAHFEHDAEDVD
ncbi:MAG: MarR family transcriptional regulator [Myxococcota bacterium]